MTATSPRLSARTALALRAGRIAGLVSRRAGVGAGVTIGGRVALVVSPKALAELAAGRGPCVISGTNGKTTTTRLIAAGMVGAGRRVVSNGTGANLASGLASALGEGDRAALPVLEIDEAVLPRVIGALDPGLVILTNLSRDQLDRYGEVGTVAGRWRQMLQDRPGQRVIANAADPLVVWAASPAETTWVDTGLTWREDATVCPACGALLEWGDGGFASACGFHQPVPDITLRHGVVSLGGEQVALSLDLPGRWNQANAAMALAACQALGVAPAAAAASMAAVREVSGRQATWALGDGRRARLLLAKNPAGWTEVLHYVAGSAAGIVLVLNCQVADGKDPSWLWDVPFELLAGRGAGRVAAAGERVLDLAVRLRYAGIEPVVEPDPLRAAAAVDGDGVEVLATYSAFVALGRRLRGAP
ncbi:MAG TPA: MurT ligase domain-containing protein [Actinomycetota bacterium]|nr:MurT ligase domain-containing protein [Actinomycetota bacterium]